MSISPVLILHICGAVIGLLSGTAAIGFRKGSKGHRAAGNVFFVSMMVMAAGGVYLAVIARLAGKSQQLLNVAAGTLTFYWVTTGWATLRRRDSGIRAFERGAMVVAFAVATACAVLGWQATRNAGGELDGYPAPAFFVFGAIALLFAAGDVRVLIRRGVSGGQRIARHLVRMCFALLITVVSFFIGKQRLFPEAVVRMNLHLVPVIAVVLVMIFWLIRVRVGLGAGHRQQAPVVDDALRDTLVNAR